LVGLLGRVIGPFARQLRTQDNTNTEETGTDIYASSGIRTNVPSVWAGEDLRLRWDQRGGTVTLNSATCKRNKKYTRYLRTLEFLSHAELSCVFMNRNGHFEQIL
jgi:hypothetical protein